jgi:MptA/FolE2 family GTP cyclohydrolase
MKSNNGIFDPVNHKISESEIKNNFNVFLNELTDVPSSVPLNKFKINRAGITNQSVYLSVRSLFSNKYVPVLAEVTMQVELDGHRGIHMSRCEESLFSLIEKRYENIEDFAIELAKNIKLKQKSNKSYVSVSAIYLAERKTVKTKKNSKDKMNMYADVVIDKKKIFKTIGLEAYNMTGCPCTETFTKFSVVPKLLKLGLNIDQVNNIIEITNSGTHTQRGLSKILIDNTDNNLKYKDLFNILDKSCVLIFELLKRPDEHELVIRALKNPQFTEDVAREIAENLLNDHKNITNESKVEISSILFDSIHIHDVCTVIEDSVSNLRKYVDGKISN